MGWNSFEEKTAPLLDRGGVAVYDFLGQLALSVIFEDSRR
jgi:hypothetical protein